jgi:flagellar basal-body rod protein FlgB
MALTTDPLFGIHAQALSIQRRRMELLASNIANADTPGFQAKDIDFKAALDAAMAGDKAAGGSPASAGAPAGEEVKFRIPLQPSVDGNTVDVQAEQAQFMDAAMHYQASLSFLDGRLKSLLTAITGE